MSLIIQGMSARGHLAAPRPIRTAALPPIKGKRANPFVGVKGGKCEEASSREEEQMLEELNSIFTLPNLSNVKRRPSPDMFGLPYKKTPSPGFKRPPSRPLHNPLSKDESFKQFSSISDASTCSSSEELATLYFR